MKKVETKEAPAAIGPYSQGIIHGELIFTSGQIPINPELGVIDGKDILEQTERAIKNVAEVLRAGGSDLDKVIKTTCYLSDMNNFSAFNSIYATYFTSCPARSCVEVSKLPKGAMVEIEAIAVIK